MKRIHCFSLLLVILVFSMCSKEETLPVAKFAVDREMATVGDLIRFTNLSENALDFFWDFGDGTTSTEKSPSHTYTAAGTFTVTLKVTGAEGENSISRTIVVSFPVPVSAFTMDKTTAEEGQTIRFTNASQHATTYTWDFGDGSTSGEANPSHAYAKKGTYTVKLTATGNGGTHFSTMMVTITEPPLAALPPAGFYSGNTDEGGTISFTIEGDKITSFDGSFFISAGGAVYEMSIFYMSFGTMTRTTSGFTVTNYWGKKLTGSFSNNKITGTWQHDYGTTGYTANKK